MADILAKGEKGQVYICDGCDKVHVHWKDFMFALERREYLAFLTMARGAGAELAPNGGGRR